MLKRELTLLDAIMMGLGSILGTGVFVSIGIAAGIAGPSVVIAIAIAALVATCNALSSAQLAANHPVSGGTYEYGYHYLKPWLGFSAGWMFLCAKSASAATAALGFAGYLIHSCGIATTYRIPIAVGVTVLLTILVLSGIRQSSLVNRAIVLLTLLALIAFVVFGMVHVQKEYLTFKLEPHALLNASALMFVAYTGYGRIATLGEEVIEPRKTIPRAILTTLGVSMVLYMLVAIVAVGSSGAIRLSTVTHHIAAPLEVIARDFSFKVHPLVALGAMTAMLGVLLNLILGLSRVLLAMGRRGDMPAVCCNLNVSILVIGILIAGLAAIGSVKTTWTFSAFTVLIYYAITNLAAMQLQQKDRLYSKPWAIAGLVACLSLAFAIDWKVWSIGCGILAVGLLWHFGRSRARTHQSKNTKDETTVPH